MDNGYQEKINAYSVNATLADDTSIAVTEQITYDFGNNEKHGIYRYIPTVYTGRKGNPRQSISIRSVTDGGQRAAFTQSNSSGSEIIKIGDSNALISGIHTYKIQYSLNRVISSDPDGDRFRWDAIGTGWDVPMKNVLITLINNGKQISNLRAQNCYVGSVGSTDTCEYNSVGNVTRVALASLAPHTGITLDLLFTDGTFPSPSKFEIWLWEAHWYYWLPLIAFLGFFLLWFEKGRDPQGRGTIVPMYDPPKEMTPYEASIIMDETISRKSLPATIISLAIQGYIKIHRKDVKALFISKPEYELELLKPVPKTAPIIEQRVADLFFTGRTTVSLSDLGDTFATSNASLHQKAYKEVTEKGYFVVNPIYSRIIFFALSLALLVIGILMAVYFFVGPLGYVAFGLPSIIGLAFAFIMPVRTRDGVIAKEDLLGLKMYIRTAEIDRIKFHNAPEKSPEKFEELLPYAIIFGLEKEWANEFKDVYKTQPSWYDGNLATFSVIALTHDLTSFSDNAIQAAVSSSSGSGEGFGGVGGGFGGGGGGSW